MTVKHVVVDGSNLATEGRTLPSLQQLDEAVRAFLDEFEPDDRHRRSSTPASPIASTTAERAAFEEAIDAGEVISPPAGVIGRGDAFVLQIADKADAVVLSNDSFQEFHGQYGWLFDQGRLIGGKPVPHVGWVFMERSPVRGPLSRRSVSDAKKAAKVSPTQAAKEPASKTGGGRGRGRPTAAHRRRSRRSRRAGRPKPMRPRRGSRVRAVVAVVAVGPGRRGAGQEGRAGDGRRRCEPAPSRSSGGAWSRTTSPLPFIEFVSAHPVGSTVSGEVERFASHGAYVLAEDTRCYLPLKHLGDPAPRSAREVLELR